MVHTKVIGETTEAIVLAEFVKAGFPVLLPFGENQRYDLVIEAGGRFLRVQCKTGRPVQGAVCFNATSHDGHRPRQGYRGQADLFAVYAPCTRQVYVLPVDEVGETSVWLRLTPTTANNQYGIRYADDYLLAAWEARYAARTR